MKKAVSLLVLFLLLTSLLTVAQSDDDTTSCSGFWGSLSPASGGAIRRIGREGAGLKEGMW